jgi:hypothetical protein
MSGRGPRNEIKIRRNKSKIPRNEIQARRNKTKVGRNEIQMPVPSASPKAFNRLC